MHAPAAGGRACFCPVGMRIRFDGMKSAIPLDFSELPPYNIQNKILARLASAKGIARFFAAFQAKRRIIMSS